MRAAWKSLNPVAGLPPARQQELAALEAGIPAFLRALLGHSSPALGGRTLREAFPTAGRIPTRLLELHTAWRGDLAVMARQRPSLVFAVVGQARAAGRITPESESDLIGALLRAWALRSTLAYAEHLTTSRRVLVRAS